MNTILSLSIAENRRPNTTTLLPLSEYDLASFSGGMVIPALIREKWLGGDPVP